MIQKIASSMAMVVFALCLVVGGLEAENSFATTVGRALQAMAATLVIGLVVGWMAQKMLHDNLRVEEEKLKNKSADAETIDR